MDHLRSECSAAIAVKSVKSSEPDYELLFSTECLDSPTPAGDVYSFGVVVLEMLTQQKPTDNSAERKGESLPTLVRASYPHQMLEILDPHLLANLDTIAATREGARKAVSLVAQV